MAIRKRGDLWQIDVFIPTGQKDEDGRDIKKRIRKCFQKKKDADAEHDKIKTLVREKRFLDVKKEYNTTFKQLLEKYEENFKHQRSFEGWKQYCLENFKEYFGEDTQLANIKYINLETYRNHLRQKLTKGGSLRTDASVNREMSCLHHIFTKAVEWDMIDRSPFDKGKSLLLKENNKRLRYLSQEEIQKLLPECPKHLRRILECAINTGMRQGEILNLKWNQIRNGFIYLTETKTDESREIPTNGDLDRLFREIRREQQFKSEYVFTYAKTEDKLKGKVPVRKRVKPAPAPEAIKSIKTAFNASLRRAGINDCRFHDLRHTFASHMIMRGSSLKEVQELLGHKDIKMTMRYAHLSQEHKQKAVNLLNGLTALPSEPAECHKMSHFDNLQNPVTG